MEEKMNILIAFDFDHTIIDFNCDTYINKLAPTGDIPKSLKNIYRGDGWTYYMSNVFKYLFENSIRKEDIFNCLNGITLTNGMKELIYEISSKNVDCIIISDANVLFIDHILCNLKLREKFKCIYTNPAKFDNEGLLHIDMYHTQDWCSLSTKNLCKGQILVDYINESEKNGIYYSHIAYIGDGTNDFCPGLCLQQCDAFFPRIGFGIMNYIDKMSTEKGINLRADTVPWISGFDILEYLRKWLEVSNKNTSILKPRLRSPRSFEINCNYNKI